MASASRSAALLYRHEQSLEMKRMAQAEKRDRRKKLRMASSASMPSLAGPIAPPAAAERPPRASFLECCIEDWVLRGSSSEYALPPISKSDRRSVGALSSRFHLDSSPCGSGDKRFILLSRTPSTPSACRHLFPSSASAPSLPSSSPPSADSGFFRGLAEPHDGTPPRFARQTPKEEDHNHKPQNKPKRDSSNNTSSSNSNKNKKTKSKDRRREYEEEDLAKGDVGPSSSSSSTLSSSSSTLSSSTLPYSTFAGDAAPISPFNIGHRLLRGMGWEGGALSPSGLTDPIPVGIKTGRKGVGF